jgi:hypothetical protein
MKKPMTIIQNNRTRAWRRILPFGFRRISQSPAIHVQMAAQPEIGEPGPAGDGNIEREAHDLAGASGGKVHREQRQREDAREPAFHGHHTRASG